MMIIMFMSASIAFAGFGTGWPSLVAYSGNDGCLTSVVYSTWSSTDNAGNVTFSHTPTSSSLYPGAGQYYYKTYYSYVDWLVDADSGDSITQTCIASGIYYVIADFYPIYWNVVNL